MTNNTNDISVLISYGALIADNITPQSGNIKKWTYDQLVNKIIEFENGLSQTQEIGIQLLSSYTLREPAYLVDINPLDDTESDAFMFTGETQDRPNIQEHQRYTELNIRLIALPARHDKPSRISPSLQVLSKSTSDSKNP